MKKLAVLLIVFVSLFLQKGNAQFNYIGGGVALSTTNSGYVYNEQEFFNNSFGIDVRMNYDYNKKIQIVPDVKIYLPNEESYSYNDGGYTKTTVFVLNLNTHLILNSRSRQSYKVYLIAGVYSSGWNIIDKRITEYETYDDKVFKMVFGGNAGAGMQLKIANRILFFAEAKYVIAESNQLVFTPGLMYNF